MKCTFLQWSSMSAISANEHVEHVNKPKVQLMCVLTVSILSSVDGLLKEPKCHRRLNLIWNQTDKTGVMRSIIICDLQSLSTDWNGLCEDGMPQYSIFYNDHCHQGCFFSQNTWKPWTSLRTLGRYAKLIHTVFTGGHRVIFLPFTKSKGMQNVSRGIRLPEPQNKFHALTKESLPDACILILPLICFLSVKV